MITEPGVNETMYGQETLTRYRFKIVWDQSKMSEDGIQEYGKDGMKHILENFRDSGSFKKSIITFENADTDTRWEWTLKMLASKEDIETYQQKFTKPDLGLSFEVLQ